MLFDVLSLNKVGDPMQKKIAKISGTFATIAAVAIVLSSLFPEEGYILFWIGVVVLVFSGIAYLATGEKPREWFWEILDLF